MKVIFIRHAEKLEWEKGLEPTESIRANYIDNHLLSPKGYERANALVGYFTNRKEMLNLYHNNPLSACVAQDVDTQWGKSERPKETIWPLIQATISSNDSIAPKLELHLFTKSKVDEMIALLKSWKDEKKTVIVCWSHQQIPEIVHKLGIKASQFPKKWDKKRFDVCWVIDLTLHSLEQYPQLLMYGDLVSTI
jgi:hypothetical protein